MVVPLSFAPTVYMCLWSSSLNDFVREFFGRGAGEPLFAKKGSPAFFHKIQLKYPSL